MSIFESFGFAPKPRYKFEVINTSLMRDDKKALVEMIAETASTPLGLEKDQRINTLVTFVAERFEDAGIAPTDESINDFIRQFKEMNQEAIQMAKQTPAVGEVTKYENVTTDTGVVSDKTVQPRRVTTDIFAGIEPVAAAPRTAADAETAMLSRVSTQVKDSKATPKNEVPLLPVDEPLHRASEDSLHGADDATIAWSVMGPEATVPPKPRQTL